MASLQKKRELQAAGIELRQKGSRRRGINYNEEVAFEKKPAIGFFDTAEENQRSKEVGEEFRPQTLEQLEGRRRAVWRKSLSHMMHNLYSANNHEANLPCMPACHPTAMAMQCCADGKSVASTAVRFSKLLTISSSIKHQYACSQ